MQHGLPSLRYLGFIVIAIGVVGFFLIHSTTNVPTRAGSKELYAFYGLRYPLGSNNQEPQSVDQPQPAAEPFGDVQQPEEEEEEAAIGPQLPDEPNTALQEPVTAPELPKPDPHSLPLDALGEISDTLTEAQCDEAFPDLYDAIDDSVRHWFLGQQKIGPKDVDISWRSDPSLEAPGGAVRFMIHRNELRILETKRAYGVMSYHDRILGILNLIQRALYAATAGGELLPTIEASLIVQDISDPPTKNGTHSFWTMTANKSSQTHERLWLVPNYDFWGDAVWGSYDDARRKAMEQDKAYIDKIPSAVWRGNPFWNLPLRKPLIDLAKHQDWADVIPMEMGEKDNALKASEYCKYAMTIHTEGVSFSGRLTQLLLCDSLPIVHDLNWKTHYTHLLKGSGADQNYASVRRDWSDLEFVANYYLQHPDEAEKVIANTVATFRNKYLTRAATSCYIRKLIKGYSGAAFVPQVERPHTKGSVRKLRGVAFEAFQQIATQDYENENKDLSDM